MQTPTGWEQVQIPLDECRKPLVTEYSAVLGFAEDGTVFHQIDEETTRLFLPVESAARVKTGCSEWKDMFDSFLMARTTGTLTVHPSGANVSACVVSLANPRPAVAASKPSGEVTVTDTLLTATGAAPSSAVAALFATMTPADGTG